METFNEETALELPVVDEPVFFLADSVLELLVPLFLVVEEEVERVEVEVEEVGVEVEEVEEEEEATEEGEESAFKGCRLTALNRICEKTLELTISSSNSLSIIPDATEATTGSGVGFA